MSAHGQALAWTFGYDGWLVCDGVYPDFQVGDGLEASIEFWVVGRLTPAETSELCIAPEGSARYRVTAKVIEVSEYVKLDLGQIRVSSHAPPMSQYKNLRVGEFIEATIGLALNPFDDDENSVAQRQQWTVDKITHSRRVESQPNGLSSSFSERIGAVSRDAVDSLDSFVLECTLALTQ